MINFFNRRSSDNRQSYSDARAQSCAADDLIIPDYDTQTALDEDRYNQSSSSIPHHSTSKTMPQVMAFMGANGGVGTTSLATQLAFELAQMCKDKKANSSRPKDPQVCLIDLDFEGGTCAYHLDLLPSLTVEDLTGEAHRIDTTFTSALVSTHQCGVSLLAVPNTPNANQIINPHAIMAMLDAASQLYRYVVVDMPRYSQSWTPAILSGADFVGLLSELTISSLHMARETLNRASKDINPAPNLHPILSKYERRSFKNTLRLGDAQTVLGQDIIGTICIDTDTCREAINCGEPIGAIRPDNRYVKDSRQLIEAIFKSCETNITSQSLTDETQVNQAKTQAA